MSEASGLGHDEIWSEVMVSKLMKPSSAFFFFFKSDPGSAVSVLTHYLAMVGDWMQMNQLN